MMDQFASNSWDRDGTREDGTEAGRRGGRNAVPRTKTAPRRTQGRPITISEAHRPSVRRAVRAAWLDYYAFRADRIFAIIERAVHEVDPSVALGFMPCAVGTSGSGAAKWSKTFSEGGNGLLVRPGGGLYTDFRPLAVMEKANNIGRQIVDVPADAKVHSEIENYPHQPLRKSPRYTAFEGLVYLNAGCTGISYNILSPSVSAVEEAEGLFAVAKRVMPYTERFARTFGHNVDNGKDS